MLVTLVNTEVTAIESTVKVLQSEISKLTDNAIMSVSKSIHIEEIDNLTYRLTDGLTEKVNTVLNCGEDHLNVKEYILSKFESFIVVQQKILDNCLAMLHSKVKANDTTTCGTEFSLQQTCPKVLCLPREESPVNQNYSSSNFPPEKINVGTIREVPSNSLQEDLMLQLTANQLLLGPNSIDEHRKFSAGLSYIQVVYKSLWKEWISIILDCKYWKDVRGIIKKYNVVLKNHSGIIQDDYLGVKALKIYHDPMKLIDTGENSFGKYGKHKKAEQWNVRQV